MPTVDGNGRVAYVLLWFPLASETFIFREVAALRETGLDIHVFTMYGEKPGGCSEAMRSYPGPAARLGSRAAAQVAAAFGRAVRRSPALVWRLMRRCLLRRMRNLETYGENLWCFLAGFRLAELCREQGMELIHAPWANGPATAAWVAAQISGIPFAFTGRAGDIYPQDGILAEKSRDAVFIRTNNAANVEWLRRFCSPEQRGKVRLVYNGLTFSETAAPIQRGRSAPHKILAVGRFARTKGFPDLFTAMARLKRENYPVHLTLVGDGSWRRKLLALRERLGLSHCIDMPGFVPNDQLAAHMRTHELLVVPSVIHGNGDRDGIPNVIMEASSVGLPIVATDVCGIGEVIVDGETGRLIEQRKPRALANAIRHMLEHPEEAERMACAARKKVLQMFDTRSNVERLRQLYLSVMDGAD